MLQIWFCRSGLCFCNFFVLTYVTAGVSHHMFSPGFLPRVLPQYFYDSVSHVSRCFNRGCSFFSSGCSGVFFHIRFLYCLFFDWFFGTVVTLRIYFSLEYFATTSDGIQFCGITCISWFASASGFYLCSARLRFTCPALLFSPISHHVGRCHIGSWLRGLCVTCFIYGSDQFLLLEEHFYMQIMCCNIIEKHSSLPRIRLSPFVIIMFSSYYGNITKIIFWYELKILRQAR